MLDVKQIAFQVGDNDYIHAARFIGEILLLAISTRHLDIRYLSDGEAVEKIKDFIGRIQLAFPGVDIAHIKVNKAVSTLIMEQGLDHNQELIYIHIDPTEIRIL